MSKESDFSGKADVEYSIPGESHTLIQLMNHLSQDIGMDYKLRESFGLRGSLNHNEVTDPSTFTLLISNPTQSENAYTSLLAYSSILLGLAQEEDTIYFPEPQELTINRLTDPQIENQYLSLVMTEHIIHQIPATDWPIEINEKIDQQIKGWKEAAIKRYETVVSRFSEPLFQKKIIPDFEESLYQDITALPEY